MNSFVRDYPKFTVLSDGGLVVINQRGQVVKVGTFRQVEDWLDYCEDQTTDSNA